MAFSVLSPSVTASAADKVAATSLSSTGTLINNPAAAGSLIIVAVAVDNTSTTDGNTAEVTGVADSKGNSYTLLREFCNSQGSAAAGATCSVWYSVITTGLAVGDSHTVTFANTVTAKAFQVRGFGIGAGKIPVIAGSQDIAVDGATGVGTPSITGLTNESHLAIIALATESSAETTTVTGYTSSGARFSSGGAASTNMACTLFHLTGTNTGSAPATTPAESADKAAVFLILREGTPGIVDDDSPWTRNAQFPDASVVTLWQ